MGMQGGRERWGEGEMGGGREGRKINMLEVETGGIKNTINNL